MGFDILSLMFSMMANIGMAGQYAPAPQSHMAIFRGPMNPSSITRATTPFFHVIAGLV